MKTAANLEFCKDLIARCSDDPEYIALYEHWIRNEVRRDPIKEQVRIARALLKNRAGDLDKLFLFAVIEILASIDQARAAALKVLTTSHARRCQIGKERKRSVQISERAKTTKAKVKSFDRIVEMLDQMQVNGKSLGDCTRADLLRAAVQADAAAGDATVRAAFFRELAAITGKGTVREASNRGQIVALLTGTFAEAA